MKRAVFFVIFCTFLMSVQSEITETPSSIVTLVTNDVAAVNSPGINFDDNTKAAQSEVVTQEGAELNTEDTTSEDGTNNDIVNTTQSSQAATVISNGTESATCDVNSTSCSTLSTSGVTEKPQNATNVTSKTEILSSNFLEQDIEEFSKEEICTCDLQLQICDINCCCDKDCTYENKLIFQKCDYDTNRFYDTNFCKYAMYIYKNNTPYEWEINQNGLFCIVKSNLPESYSLHEKLSISSLEEANLQKSNKYSWSPIEEYQTDNLFNPNEKVHYGQKIWILKNFSNIQPLEIPDSFVTSACLSTRQVKFLENVKTKCTHNTVNEENKFLNVEYFVQNATVISIPVLANISWNETVLKVCPRNICIPVEVKICKNFFEECSNLTSNNTAKFRLECSLSLYEDIISCNNLVQKVKYNLHHNGTQGIQKAEALIILKNDTFSLRRDALFSQEFEVNYIWVNYTVNYSHMRSGNPGYIVGKRILTANLLLPKNITTAKLNHTGNYTLYRNYFDPRDNFMAFPANKNGLCVFTSSVNVPVEFGYNMILNCKIREKLQRKNLTAKYICRKIQNEIFRYWSVKINNQTMNFSKVVGNFGNANNSDIKDWSVVSYVVGPTEVLNSTNGTFGYQNKTLLCQNIYTHLKVDFYHGREVVKNLHNQEKILWVTFSFVNRRDFSFEVLKDEIQIETDQRIEVVFFDITTEKIKKFADPPTFKITLPYDFFYPFIKVGSSNNVATYNCDYYLLLLCFFMYFVKLIHFCCCD